MSCSLATIFTTLLTVLWISASIHHEQFGCLQFDGQLDHQKLPSSSVQCRYAVEMRSTDWSWFPQQSRRKSGSIPGFPSPIWPVKSLTNLTVSYVHSWKGASQIGLIKLPFTVDNMLRLEYLDLTGNSLENDDVLSLIPTMTGLKQLYLEGNRISILPEMKNLFSLDHLSWASRWTTLW